MAQRTLNETQRLLSNIEELEKIGCSVLVDDDLQIDIERLISKQEEIKKKAEEKFEQERIESPQHIDVFEFFMENGMDSVMDSVVPACCKHGCMVEPDGYCEHGNPSMLIANGLI
jgi:hypothetical protein